MCVCVCVTGGRFEGLYGEGRLGAKVGGREQEGKRGGGTQGRDYM